MTPYQVCGGAILTAVFLSVLLWAFPIAPKVWHEENDAYECFGAARYDAMRDGRVCPEWERK